MSLFSALNVGVSGLNAQSRAIGNISDNLANTSTTGYKRTDTSFQQLVVNSSARNNTPGGVIASPVYRNNIQGALQSTASGTDLAITGNGFFTVAATPNQPQLTYSRRGDFLLNNNGFVVNGAGQFLRAYAANQTPGSNVVNVNTAALVPVQINPAPLPAVATGTINYNANLPSNYSGTRNQFTLTLSGTAAAAGAVTTNVAGTAITSAVTVGSTAASRASDLASQINASAALTNAGISAAVNGGQVIISGPATGTAITVTSGAAPPAGLTASLTQTQAGAPPNPLNSSINIYDSLGNLQTVQLTWTKLAAPNQWQLDVASPGGAGGVTTTNVVFNNAGQLQTIGGVASNTLAIPQVTFPGAQPQTVAVNFGAAGLTQFADTQQQLAVRTLSQDGSGTGTFQDLTVSRDGFIVANYSNGLQRSLYQIPLATFPAPNSLQRNSGGALQQTVDSGNPIFNVPGSGGAGTLTANTLEGSNVDISDEFSKLIVSQRVFSANARIITTTDKLLEEVVNLKR